MRRRLAVGMVLGTALILLGAIAVRRASAVLEASRQRLEARVGSALGRSVRIAYAGFSLRHGIAVRLSDVRVAEDPRFGSGDFLHLAHVVVVPRLRDVVRGRWSVRRLVLDEPDLVLVRTEDGLNVRSLGRSGERRAAAGGGIVRVVAPATEAPGATDRVGGGTMLAGLLHRLAVRRVTVREATVRWRDRRPGPAVEVTFGPLSGELRDLSPTTAVRIDARTPALADGRGRAEIRGSVGPLGTMIRTPAATPIDLVLVGSAIPFGLLRAMWPDLARAGVPDALPLGGQLRLSGVAGRPAIDARLTAGPVALVARGTIALDDRPQADVELELPRVALAAFADLVPTLAAAGTAGEVEARLRLRGPLSLDDKPPLEGTIALYEAAFGVDGPAGITTTLRLDGEIVELPPTRVEIGDTAMQLAVRARQVGPQVWLEDVRIEGFGGTMRATGRLDARDPARPRAVAEGTAHGLSAGKLLAAVVPDVAERIQGRLDGEFAVSVTGRTRDAWRRSLAGSVHLTADDVVVRGFNLVESLLDGMAGGLGGVVTLLPPRVRSAHPELFGVRETRMDTLRLRSRFAGPMAHVEELVAGAPAWGLEAAGTLALGGVLDLRGTFTAKRPVATEIAAAVREVELLLDESGRLAVPFRLSGVPPDLRAVPDPGFLARGLRRGLLERGLLERGLERFFQR